MTSGTVAELRGLDRVSGATTDLAVAVGGSTRYGRLEVRLMACRYPADNPNSEAFAFLEILDPTRSERLFLGWMVASSPALNALDHARYDVWVLGCRQGTVAPATPPSAPLAATGEPSGVADPNADPSGDPSGAQATAEGAPTGLPPPVATSPRPPRRPTR